MCRFRSLGILLCTRSARNHSCHGRRTHRSPASEGVALEDYPQICCFSSRLSECTWVLSKTGPRMSHPEIAKSPRREPTQKENKGPSPETNAEHEPHAASADGCSTTHRIQNASKAWTSISPVSLSFIDTELYHVISRQKAERLTHNHCHCLDEPVNNKLGRIRLECT